MHNCPTRWFTVVDEMSVHGRSVVDELSFNGCVEAGADEAAIHTIELHLDLFLLILLLSCFYIMLVKGRWSNCKRRLTKDCFTLHNINTN